MGFKTIISKMHYEKETQGLKRSFLALLKFCSFFYLIGSKLKNLLYDKGILKSKKVNAYVISVGNLTTGGVGKTPIVAKIAQYYSDKGEKVAIVSRGYGGKLSGVKVISDGENIFFNADKSGDEPLWLAQNTKAIVITSKDRYKGAEFAIDKFGVSKIILDDGFQHRKLHRDLDIVLVDSKMKFGNENLLPAGPLREGLEAFGRIDKMIIVSKDIEHISAEKYAKIIRGKLKKEPIVCYTEPDYVYNIFIPEEHLDLGEKVLAFSAIGQPEQFYNFLKDYNVEKTVNFDDHHNYTKTDIAKLQQLCVDLGIKKLITTEKDSAKLVNFGFYLSIYALKLKTKLDVKKLINEKN